MAKMDLNRYALNEEFEKPASIIYLEFLIKKNIQNTQVSTRCNQFLRQATSLTPKQLGYICHYPPLEMIFMTYF